MEGTMKGIIATARREHDQLAHKLDAHDRNWTYLGIGSLVYQFPWNLKYR